MAASVPANFRVFAGVDSSSRLFSFSERNFLMKKIVSIKKNRDFRILYRRGKSAVDSVLAMYVRKNKRGYGRVGITVSTKVGKAVVRNRVRRRIREVYRLNRERLRPGYDIIAVARVRAGACEYRDIEKSFLFLAGKLGILSEEK